MNKYTLLNPSPILAELSESIDSGFLPFEDKACVNYWKNVLNSLTVNQYGDYITWSNIERYETIHYLEAIFLLLNLPTRFLVENKEFDLFKPATAECLDESIRQIFSTSVECTALERSHQVTPHTPYADEMVGHYQVMEFIEWAIETGFVAKVGDDLDSGLDKNPLGKYNDYRGWAKVHNTITSLVALELYEGRLTSTSSILKDKDFYGNLSKKLAPKTQDGQDKPKPKTLENYISEYNNFNK
ncbi:MAG: hypothetical protein ABGY11_08250 [Candidatus Thioglobus sp.]|jgi:hypothetical protein